MLTKLPVKQRIKNQSIIGFLSLFLLTGLPVSTVQALEDVGDVHFSRGSVAARADGTMRILNKGSDIYLDDNIQTSERSFAVLDFEQGDRMTVRPNSSLTIEDPLPIKLHEGGLKASSKGKAEPMRVQVGDSVIKTESASFSVRVCGVDCAEEVKKGQKAKAKKISSVIARVTEIKGTVIAVNSAKPESISRTLKLGSAIYRLDRLTSSANSYALLVFRDKGKMTVQQETIFDIDDYHYNDAGLDNVADYSLVKGGLRILTGAIGKQNKAALKVSTPVATIGIRGTGFDLRCQGDCVGDTPSQTKGFKNIYLGKSEGLYAHVWQGVIYQQNEAGEFDLKEGESSYIANEKSKPETLPVLPKTMQSNPAPRPDASKDGVGTTTLTASETGTDSTSTSDIEMQEATLFATEEVEGTPPGVYVTVYDGDVELITGDESINIGIQETGYVATETTSDGVITATADPIRLEEVVVFETQDPYPTPDGFDSTQAAIGTFSLLSDPTIEDPAIVDTGFVCEIQ